jgi:alkylation response protein AidB-like acyl-CoA dehydrogenase
MEIGYTPDQQALRAELREYYDALLDDETVRELSHARGVGPVMRRVWKQMCSDGWAAVGWPKEYGGQGFSAIEQFVFFDVSMRAGAPVPMLTINTVGPTIMRFGSEEQKELFLPKILGGEIHFAMGSSEPGAGTALASLTPRGVRLGVVFVNKGLMLWPSLARDADFVHTVYSKISGPSLLSCTTSVIFRAGPA